MTQSQTTMPVPGAHTRAELFSQPGAWRNALATLDSQIEALHVLWSNGAFTQIVVTGCGSPFYAALSAAASLRERGLNAVAAPASEVWLDPRAAYPAASHTLLVVLSRSGETTELLRAVTAFRARGDGDVVTITCTPGSSLSKVGTLNLVLEAGREESFAQTRAFTVMLIAALTCAAVWSGDAMLRSDLAKLPDACAALLNAYGPLALQLGTDAAFDRFYFLGSGARHGLACEISLKMKEMSISHSEPFHFLEFRHGPQTMVAPSALVIGMVSAAQHEQETAVLNDMRALGGAVLAIGVGSEATLPAELSDCARGPLYVVVGQMLALEHALALGRNPDRPHNLHAVVTL